MVGACWRTQLVLLVLLIRMFLRNLRLPMFRA
jgi:hypothetical protein